MTKKLKNDKFSTGTIALHKRAKFEYHLDQRIEAGLVLTGWEIKSIRDGRANLTDSYVVIKAGEAFLIGAHFSPLMTACTHVVAEPRRERKLLLNKKEISRLFAASSQTGQTIVATAL
jgi:SsrA-binding protein